MSWPPKDVLYSEDDEYLKGFFGSWNRYFRQLLGKKRKKRTKNNKDHPRGGKARNVSTKMHVWVEVFVNGECVSSRRVNEGGKRNKKEIKNKKMTHHMVRPMLRPTVGP